MKRPLILTMAMTILTAAVFSAEPDASLAPIQEIKNVQPGAEIFKVAKRGQPLVVESAEEAAKHFGKEALAKLKENVDFEHQIVLVFAWRGSGQDQLTYDVAESFPEQVFFQIKPGRTRDLRPHVHVFALRSNVKWSVK